MSKSKRKAGYLRFPLSLLIANDGKESGSATLANRIVCYGFVSVGLRRFHKLSPAAQENLLCRNEIYLEDRVMPETNASNAEYAFGEDPIALGLLTALSKPKCSEGFLSGVLLSALIVSLTESQSNLITSRERRWSMSTNGG